MKNRISFKEENTIQVFRFGTTSNSKIEADPKRKIVQTFTFSKKQFEAIANKTNKGMKHFFSLADTNCLDCPFNEFGKCYTHKPMQYMGFISMLKSIVKEFGSWEQLPSYSNEIGAEIIKMSANQYVRFGSYGEPSLHPLKMIEAVTLVCKNWTGYTHQYNKVSNVELGQYFMASTHTIEEEKSARKKGFRSFVVTPEKTGSFTSCPASKEMGYKSSCSKCGLCSGTKGTKATKSIEIINH